MAGSYYRDGDVLVRELEPGSPQRWNGRWVDYPRFEWARAQELTLAQARGLAPEAFEYPALPGLEHVYLEDSYVLDVDTRGGEVRVDLEAVVLPGHPAYQPPRAGEQYCYLAGVLRFTGARDVDLRRSGRSPSVDPDGSTDYGNVDVFRVDGEWFELHGDWGSLRLRADPPELHVYPLPEHLLPQTHAHPVDQLLADLRAERRLPPEQRPTGAATASLELVIRELRRIRGGLTADTATIRHLVTDEWQWHAELCERVLTFTRAQ